MNLSLDIQTGYDLWASSYDKENNYLVSLDEQNSGIRQKAILAAPRQTGCALDICCGTGRYIPFLESHYNQVLAVDISKRMLSIAQRKSTRSNTLFIEGDFQDVSIPSKVDYAQCSLALMHFKNSRKFLEKISDILVPRGVFLLTDATPQILNFGTTPNFDRNGIKYIVGYHQHRLIRILDVLQHSGMSVLETRFLTPPESFICQHEKYGRYRDIPSLYSIIARRESST